MNVLTETYTLNNGVSIPKVGFGTWQIPAGKITYDSVTYALEMGYRHIDTAWAYHNEKSVGKAVRDFGIDRNEIFVTSKCPAEAKSYTDAKRCFEETMGNLDLDYMDLYLIHAPWPWSEMGTNYSEENLEVWRLMEEVYQSGKVKAIGISNFNVTDMKNIFDHCTVKPMVNQIRYFIGFTEPDITKYAKDNGLLVEAYSPLATGRIINNADLKKIAGKYSVSVAQLSIRYCLQKGVLPLPKAINPDHIRDNAAIDFTISEADIAYLDQLVTSR
ncbi:aldo/keto reductase [Sporolactobacillus spathodeae]|uniref:Diketogulonate reductase-like aldo/keto reductase n=1 Tax=Sporolactobacillus spathodeae TaxID=1465502 RepID=A0ABS2QBP6_9BACL|nr:aldo/keto reductase [Sporolactobacillus spathodeae]MBM7659056.1 diketogulonate reductase-like aldo/keto reductase [Sporolactobacillus spathodeae]